LAIGLGLALLVASACAYGLEHVGARAAALDETFSSDGLWLRDFFRHDEALAALAVTRRGRILVAGTADRNDSGTYDDVIVALRDDGSQDPSFGHGGVLSNRRFGAADIVEQPNGRIVLAGSTRSSAAVMRLLPDGSRDPSFGRSGLSVIPRRALGPTDDCITATTADNAPGGRIVVGGMFGCGGEDGYDAATFVARMRRDGRLDRSFANGGVRVSHSSCLLSDVAAQRNGTIVTAGSTGSSDYCTFGSMLLTRLRSDGTPDSSFAPRGRLQIRYAHTRESGANAVSVDRRGRITAAGWAGNRVALARVTPSGTLDPTFDGDGKTTLHTRTRAQNYATDLAADRNRRLMLTARDRLGNRNVRFVVLRFLADGRPDPAFGTDGMQVVSFGSNWERAERVSVDRAGRTVVAGEAFPAQGDPDVADTGNDFAVARLR
jgi:uncharacterized delta-60 repeat protein